MILCAQEIEFTGNGQIDARGGDGTANNHGGGGGGLIVLIAGKITGDSEYDSHATPVPAGRNVLYGGGKGHGTGKEGGKGRYLKFIVT